MSEPDFDDGHPPEEIDLWLDRIQLAQYAASFRANNITLEILPVLDDADLKACGVESLGHRKILLRKIHEQFPDAASAAVPTPAEQRPAPAFPAKPASAAVKRIVVPRIAPAPPSPAPAPDKPPAPGAAPIPSQSAARIAPAAAAVKDPDPPRRKLWRRLLASKIILFSIAMHLLLGIGATYYIVQTIQAKRKLTFQGGPPSPNRSTRALEHKVSVARRKKTMSAPAQARRIMTTGLSKISMPEMPHMPGATDIVPGKMAGMGGMGVGFGAPGGMGSAGGGGGGGMPFFGFHSGNGLQGYFYDLKQTPSRRPTPIKNVERFVHELNQFLENGWNPSFLDRYFKAPNPLYATQLFVPVISSVNAPRAFGVEREVKPALWMAIYSGKVSPPETGVYHFVGGGDNILIVRLNSDIVLDKSWDYRERWGIDKAWTPIAMYDYGFPRFGSVPGGFAKGQAVTLVAGTFYHIEVLFGDDGGQTHFSLLVEKEGVQYQKTASGLPILPVFRVAPDRPPPGSHPPFMDNGPIWSSRPSSNSLFSP